MRFGTFYQGTDNERVKANITISANPYKAGIFSRASSTKPNTYLQAYRTATSTILEEVKNGSTTTLINNTSSEVAGAELAIWTLDDTVALYYNNGLVSKVTTTIPNGQYHGTFDKFGGNVISDYSNKPLSTPSYVSLPTGAVGRFVWTSDIHRSRNPEFGELCDWIDTLNANCYIDTGDVDVQYSTTAYQNYAADVATMTTTRYNVPGNHDNNAPAYDYADYNTYVGMDHFALTIGNLRLIGYKVTANSDSSFSVSAGEKAFVLGELAALGSLKPVLFAHQPYYDADMIADFIDKDIVAFLHGHNHHNCLQYSANGFVHIDGGSADTTTNTDNSINNDGGFMIVDIFTDHLDISFARAKWPFDPFDTNGAGNKNDVYYSPISISF